ncbi:MAG: MOSC N-terminal beta barrel domain-containing protein, partial [Pirellulales bacterium]
MPTLDRITVYPVKSLDGVEVAAARLLAEGALEHDRRWQLVDMEGRVVNAKRMPIVHAIRTEFQVAGLEAIGSAVGELPGLGPNVVSLAVDPAALAAAAIPGVERLTSLGPDVFPLVPGSAGPCGWLSEAFGFGVLLLERREGGFPDDRDAPGPTLAATATLAEVARWFSLDIDEARRRFRVNLEIGGCDAFWEDTLASPAREAVEPPPAGLPADLLVDPYAALPPPEPRELAIGAA